MSAAERKFEVGQRVEWIEEEVGGNPESGPRVFQTRMSGEYVGTVVRDGKQRVLVDLGTDEELTVAMELILPHRPECRVPVGDNVYAVIGAVDRALRRDGQAGRGLEFRARAKEMESYEAVLALCEEYVEVL